MQGRPWIVRNLYWVLYVVFAILFLLPSIYALNHTVLSENFMSSLESLEIVLTTAMIIQAILLSLIMVITMLSAIMIANTYSTRMLGIFSRFPDIYIIASLYAFNIALGTIMAIRIPELTFSSLEPIDSGLLALFIVSVFLSISSLVPYFLRLLRIMKFENVLISLTNKGIITRRPEKLLETLKTLAHFLERSIDERDQDAFRQTLSAISKVMGNAIFRGLKSDKALWTWLGVFLDNLKGFAIYLVDAGQSQAVLALVKTYGSLGVALQEVNEDWDCLVCDIVGDLKSIRLKLVESDLRETGRLLEEIWATLLEIVDAGPASSNSVRMFSECFAALQGLLKSGHLDYSTGDSHLSLAAGIRKMSGIETRFFKSKIFPDSRWEEILQSLAGQRPTKDLMEALKEAIESSVKGLVKAGQCAFAYGRLHGIYEHSTQFRGFLEGFFDASMLNEFVGNTCPVNITVSALNTMKDFILDNLSVDNSFLLETGKRLQLLDSPGDRQASMEVLDELKERLDDISKTGTHDKRLNARSTIDMLQKAIIDRE